MDTERSAVPRRGQGGPSRVTAVGGVAVFLLTVGAVATTTAAAASLLVESVLAKRVLWGVVLLTVSVSAGLWRGTQSVTASPPNSDRLPYVPRAGSPQ